MYSLALRPGLAAVDGAPVPGTAIILNSLPSSMVAWFNVVVTGTPTTYNARAAIEASPDGGTTWHQVVRFADLTNAVTGTRIARSLGVSVGAEAPVAASALGSAQTSPGVVMDCPWPNQVRAVTQFQALTGGTSPTLSITVLLDVGDD